MSHTNQTPNYHLPQFLGTDKPAWLVDVNQAMSDIDTQMKANATASATAEANAQSALSGVSALNSQVGGLQTDVTAIQTQMPLDEAQISTNAQNISTQASAIVNANNRIDALNGKVGDLADLDTTDKSSIVDAVNEVKAEVDAGKVSTFGTSVEVTSYIEGTSRFTCPSDGYCEIHTTNVDQTVTLYINGLAVATVYGTDSTRYDRTPVYVRKGMQLSVASSSNGYAYYIPIAE